MSLTASIVVEKLYIHQHSMRKHLERCLASLKNQQINSHPCRDERNSVANGLGLQPLYPKFDQVACRKDFVVGELAFNFVKKKIFL